MRLHLSFLDHPEDYSAELLPPQWVTVQNRHFRDESVAIDNHQFGHCSFQGCMLLYSGGPFGFFECDIDYTSGLVATGSAARTLKLWNELSQVIHRRHPGSG